MCHHYQREILNSLIKFRLVLLLWVQLLNLSLTLSDHQILWVSKELALLQQEQYIKQEVQV